MLHSIRDREVRPENYHSSCARGGFGRRRLAARIMSALMYDAVTSHGRTAGSNCFFATLGSTTRSVLFTLTDFSRAIIKLVQLHDPPAHLRNSITTISCSFSCRRHAGGEVESDFRSGTMRPGLGVCGSRHVVVPRGRFPPARIVENGTEVVGAEKGGGCLGHAGAEFISARLRGTPSPGWWSTPDAGGFSSTGAVLNNRPFPAGHFRHSRQGPALPRGRSSPWSISSRNPTAARCRRPQVVPRVLCGATGRDERIFRVRNPSPNETRLGHGFQRPGCVACGAIIDSARPPDQ